MASPLAQMYKCMSIMAYEVLIHKQKKSDRAHKMVLLDVKPKELLRTAPLILFCHGSKRDLGSLCHYFVDLASQLKAEVVSFELPYFCSEAHDDTRAHRKITERLLMTFAMEAFEFIKDLATVERQVFIYGQGAGAIPAVAIARDWNADVSGLIL